jgi:uncharacterized protein (TIGR03067 family)
LIATMSEVPAGLTGTWEMIRAESAGEPSPDLIPLRVELQLTADTYAFHLAGEIADRGTYAVMAAQPHHALALCGTLGPNNGRTIPCIYQLAGDRLRICYGLDENLPSDFKTTADSQLYLATYRRKSA